MGQNCENRQHCEASEEEITKEERELSFVRPESALLSHGSTAVPSMNTKPLPVCRACPPSPKIRSHGVVRGTIYSLILCLCSVTSLTLCLTPHINCNPSCLIEPPLRSLTSLHIRSNQSSLCVPLRPADLYPSHRFVCDGYRISWYDTATLRHGR